MWEKVDGKIHILKIAKEEFSGSLEDLIETADRAISKASFGVPQEKLNKVIFAVPSSWSQDGKIEANYLQILKNVCASLSLKPLGFVLTTEAIVKAMESIESVKINFLLLHIGPEILNLSYIEHGSLTETVSSLRSEAGVGEDLLELLSRFKTASLPNKIIVFDGAENLENIKQEIIKTPLTQKEKRFLHFPTVETLGEDADISAVIHTVGEQMGVKIHEKKVESHVIEKPKEQIAEKVIAEKPVKEKVETAVEEKIQIIKKPPEEKYFSPEEVESLGFFFDKDVGAKQSEIQKEEKEEKEEGEQKLPRDFAPKKAILIILGFLLAVIFLILAFWFLFSKAEVILNVKTKKFDSDITIFLTKSNSSKDSTLSGKEISVTVNGEMEAAATGKKKTGDKAKGEVVIFNKNTDGEKTFNKGTVISDGNLKFILDADVTVASASMNTEAGSETKIFGKSTVNVTAEKFGNEYNIEDNKDWSIGNFSQSSYSAHNERAFSGGTTREIQVVSESDRNSLLSRLEKSLEQKANTQVAGKIDKEKEDILNLFTSKKIIDKKFSAEVNDEVKKFNLSLKIQFSTFSYLKSDAKKILDKLLIGKIPSGLFLNQNSISLKLNKAEAKDDGYNLNFSYEARAVPEINLKDLTGKIKLQPVSALDKWLKTDDIADYKVSVWPPLPLLSSLMPPKAGNIKINLKY